MKGRPRVGLLWFIDSTVLFKIAGAMTVTSTAILYTAVKYEKCERASRWSTRRCALVADRVLNRPYYQQALHILHAHEQALAALGAPIEVGHVDLTDIKRNWHRVDAANVSESHSGEHWLQMCIPLSGQHETGYLHVRAHTVPDTQRTGHISPDDMHRTLPPAATDYDSPISRWWKVSTPPTNHRSMRTSLVLVSICFRNDDDVRRSRTRTHGWTASGV
jgi:hypothetical protein